MARTLTVYLAADVAKFKRSMDNAGDSAHGLRGKVGGLADTIKSNFGPAMLGAAAAVGGMAVALGVDGVQAAIADQQEVTKLTTAMTNLGLASDTGPILAQIDAMQRATGVSEGELRPAYQRLVTSLGDADAAMASLKLALDIAISTGKPLETVVQALGKAYDGNTGALGRLGVGIDKATLKSGNLDTITQTLSDRFGGAAAANAATYQGKIDQLTVGFDELKESFGQGFLDGLTGAEGGLGSITDFMAENEQGVKDFGKSVGELATGMGNVASKASEARTSMVEWGKTVGNDQTGTAISKIISNVTSLQGTLLLFVEAVDAASAAYQRWNSIAATGTYANDGSAEAAFGKPGNRPEYSSQVPSVRMDPISTSKSLATIQATARARTGG